MVEGTTERLRRALAFVAELARRAAALGCLQGALLQARCTPDLLSAARPAPSSWSAMLLTTSARSPPPLQALVAWQTQQEQQKQLHAESGGRAGLDALRLTLNSADGTRDEGAPLLARLGPAATRAMADAAADLRALLRVKVADDTDLKTARQALAEAGYFFVALRREAEGLGVSPEEQLKQYT